MLNHFTRPTRCFIYSAIFFFTATFTITGTLYASTAKRLNLTNSSHLAHKKTTTYPDVSDHNWYFSWGYNKDYWSNSDIHISQPALNNNFTVYDVTASDDPSWTHGIFNKDLMVPQYNIRIGHFLNKAHTWAIELSFDHTKYNSDLYQIAYVKGIINGVPVAGNQVLTPSYFNYKMHNGTNQLMLNIVRRKHLLSFFNTRLRLIAIGKFGLGILLPHPINTILGNTVDVGPKASGNYFGWRNGWWQMGGFAAGASLGFQLSFFKSLYLEITDKEIFNDLSDIQVYKGRASQKVWLNEIILNLGTTF